MTALPRGFRALELRSLTWSDVAFRRRMTTVRAGYVKNGTAPNVPMNQLLTDVLESVKLAYTQSEQVFYSRDGMPYRSCRGAFEPTMRKAAMLDGLDARVA